MISKFLTFNESVSEEDMLFDYINDTFAYLSDDYNVIIEKKDKEIFIEIKTILPTNIIWKLDEYIKKSVVWQEALLDIDVAVQQIESKFKNISYKANVNTVGNVKLSFLLLNDKLMTSNNLSITIGKKYLLKLIDDEKVNDILVVNSSYNRNELRIYLKDQVSPDYQKRLADKIVKVFNDNGIEGNSTTSTMFDDYAETGKGVVVKTYNYDVNNLPIIISVPRDNNKAVSKRIKLQNVV